MSAQPGWYPQPDGRQRWWDGTQWTEHFHDPAAGAQGQGTAEQSAHQQTRYGQSTYGQSTHGQSTYGQSSTGQPGAAQYPYGGASAGATPPAKSGVGKGCLIAAAIVAVLLALMAVAGIVLFNRAKDRVDEIFPSGFPSSSSYDDGSSSAPSDGPGTGGAEATGKPGEPITVGDVQIAAGWTVGEPDSIGFTKLENIKLAAPAPAVGFFEVEALNGAEMLSSTICTAEKGSADLSCMPFTEDIKGATEFVFKKSF